MPATTFRQIYIFIDGTNNSPITGMTNVQRLYAMLDRTDKQITYYQPGVGTLEPVGAIGQAWVNVLTFIDKTTAFMMKRHVCSAYEFLSETVLDDDDIYIFGFSRGAFTARVLAGMIARVGILHPGMREMTHFAWKTYLLSGKSHESKERLDKFKAVYSRNVSIKFLGLWDTVSSAGLPWAPTDYPLADTNPNVRSVAHAMSIDECRVGFEVRKWKDHTSKRQDVKQVWFAGVHSDVGGGYDEKNSSLAKISLYWMIQRLSSQTKMKWRMGANVSEKVLNLDVTTAVKAAANQERHDESLKWQWKWLEYVPLPRWSSDAGKPAFRMRPHLRARRNIRPGEEIHPSVQLLMQHGQYEPANVNDALTFTQKKREGES